MNKTCPRCKEEKDPSLFGKDKNRKDGLNPYCKICLNEKSKNYFSANAESVRKTKIEYDRRNKEKIAGWRADNSEYLRSYWAEYGKRYRAENIPETRAKTRRQQAARRKAVPGWIDRAKEVAVYEEAARRRLLGENVEVDHIVPILGKNFCGLHWHGNLRVISAFANRSRGNKLDHAEHPLAFAREGADIAALLAASPS